MYLDPQHRCLQNIVIDVRSWLNSTLGLFKIGSGSKLSKCCVRIRIIPLRNIFKKQCSCTVIWLCCGLWAFELWDGCVVVSCDPTTLMVVLWVVTLLSNALPPPLVVLCAVNLLPDGCDPSNWCWCCVLCPYTSWMSCDLILMAVLWPHYSYLIVVLWPL